MTLANLATHRFCAKHHIRLIPDTPLTAADTAAIALDWATCVNCDEPVADDSCDYCANCFSLFDDSGWVDHALAGKSFFNPDEAMPDPPFDPAHAPEPSYVPECDRPLSDFILTNEPSDEELYQMDEESLRFGPCRW